MSLDRLTTRWRRQFWFLRFLQALVAVPLVLAGGLSPWWATLVFVSCGIGLRLIKRPPGRVDVARYLDRTVPELEESTTLLLTPNPEGLAALQVQRVRGVLEKAPGLPTPYKAAFRRTIYLLIASVSVASLVLWIPHRHQAPALSSAPAQAPEPDTTRRLRLTITPPAYTGKTARTQTDWDLSAEEGARLHWQVSGPRTLVFSDSTRLTLHNGEGEKMLTHPGFYRVDGTGPFYKMEMIPDQAPVIRVPIPASYTVIDLGAPLKVSLRVQLSDDYGVAAAMIHLTTASGSGEAVRFKELTQAFHTAFSSHLPAYDLRETIDLGALGLHPGDDLYFYITATDTHHQESHSDRFIVSLPDTAQLMSLEGLASAVNVKPEFFRSERQIIIETEALLKDQPTLSQADFQQKSLDLGTDQKLLHLRYGQFLGEESESAAEEAPHAGNIVQEAQDFGNAEKLIDAYSDKHDNAEDATFFDPATKEKLKATLNEMWKAEVRFRTYQPAAALPFAYKALRLLKDLQQQSRAYVAKTGVKVPPLKPEKRLTGDLGSIINPVHRDGDRAPLLSREQAAIGVLEQLRTDDTVGRLSATGAAPALGTTAATGAAPALGVAAATPTAALAPAQALLIRAAASEPLRYLPALEAIGRIQNQISGRAPADPRDIRLVEKALHRLLPTPAFAPGGATGSGYHRLSSAYFDHLNNAHP